ncbi:hypothetical protein DYU11_03900 [Fibrisoma montanum]|uniref:Uncharacterized protein n=1 Tax=Fibrisoma montanum TaxID=2305895 RepID=A0A418MJ70_9BACT|nr:hypothetical protein [Fibrisoma montanum]RIV27459.1 hypothetical protein DYU11_03900 [Fibrisoma montanum]
MKVVRSVLVLWLTTVVSTGFGQTPIREQLIGTWIGLGVQYDDSFYRPYPISMTLTADSSYVLRLIDQNPPARRATWSFGNRSIRLDTSTYKVGQWTLTADTLRLTGIYPLSFQRLTDIAIDSVLAYQTLLGHVWTTDSLRYALHAGGSACLENTKTGDIAIHCWRLAKVGQSVFLVIKGNQQGCEGNFQFPLQIMQVSPEAVVCIGGNERGTDRLVFRRGAALKAGESCQPKGFQLCNSYAYLPFHLYPYYTYRRGRLHAIRQVVEREYKPISLPGQSGLIRFRFMINCMGEAGRFEVLEVDEEYKTSQFDIRITSQLVDICRNKLTDWEAGHPNGYPDSPAADTVCLLTFRLKDGMITEIFP